MASPIITASLLNASRRCCPKCGRRQSVSAFAAQQAVVCRKCGASIPPPSAADAKSGDKPGGKR
jgi:uncharacterized protein (DUF983 family)